MRTKKRDCRNPFRAGSLVFGVRLAGADTGGNDFLVGLQLVGEIGNGHAEGLRVVVAGSGKEACAMTVRPGSMENMGTNATKTMASINSKGTSFRMEVSFGHLYLSS